MKKIFKERPMPDDIEFKEKNYGRTANVFVAAAGAAAAAGPYAGMAIAQKIKKCLSEEDFVSEREGAFVTSGGAPVEITPIAVDDFVFGCRSGYEVVSDTREAFEGIKERFGEYGAREVFGKGFESALQPSDIKEIAKSGYNCVVIPIRSFLIFKDEKINKKSLRLKRLDKIIRNCGKNGIYVILKLCDTPGFDPGRDEFSIFDNGKQALAHRNYLIKLWEKIGTHYKDEPAVLAYWLLDTDCFDAEKYSEAYDSICARTEKVLREAGDNHILLGYGNTVSCISLPVFKGDSQEKCVYCKPKDFIDIGADSFEDMGIKVSDCSNTKLFTKLV